MVYELKNEQLVPHEKFWGTLPKIEMLDKNKVIVCFTLRYIITIWVIHNLHKIQSTLKLAKQNVARKFLKD